MLGNEGRGLLVDREWTQEDKRASMRTYGHKWTRRCCLMTAMLQAFGVLALMVALRVSQGVRASYEGAPGASELSRSESLESPGSVIAARSLRRAPTSTAVRSALRSRVSVQRERFRLAPKTSPPSRT